MKIFVEWYLIIQIINLVFLSLTYRLFNNLPDRGYSLNKSFGILSISFILWVGTSYGLLLNDSGGTWLVVLLMIFINLILYLKNIVKKNSLFLWLRKNILLILCIESLFFIVFASWYYVRSHNPAVSHTEQPMDLMFMYSIWNSPTFPPHDSWLSGYPISYYYFGYWMLVTVGRLANQPPEIAYNVGQACWYSLLFLGCFGVVYNLLSTRNKSTRNKTQNFNKIESVPVIGGIFAAIVVGASGNIYSVIEWLYAQGINVTALARLIAVNNFPDQAQVTGQWFIGNTGWVWRSSRILQDYDVTGQLIAASPITEIPIFSYLLGDNHPHILAMPFVLLVIGFAFNFFLSIKTLPQMHSFEDEASPVKTFMALWEEICFAIPGGYMGLVVICVAAGGLIFLNTWDFPPYLFLLTIVFFFVIGHHCIDFYQSVVMTVCFIGLIILIIAMIYLPYFLTAQSQAQGVAPNLFYPTAFSQFFVLWGHFLFGIVGLIVLAWQELKVAWNPIKIVIAFLCTIGLPIIFLLICALALDSPLASTLLTRFGIPQVEGSYFSFALGRWLIHPWTFLALGVLISFVSIPLCQFWQVSDKVLTEKHQERPELSTIFVLILSLLGLLLIYAPEFVYLRDYFGVRMNTIFKFYYQGWLLLGLSSVYAIIVAFQNRSIAVIPSGISLLLMSATLFYPIAGVYSETNGLQATTLSINTLDHLMQYNPNEQAAIEWVRRHTPINALIVQGKGDSYWPPSDNLISVATGRPTLLGWEWHERQWRGDQFDQMVAGRSEALSKLYKLGMLNEIKEIIQKWKINYIYVGPVEREQYQITSSDENRFREIMDLVFEQGDVRIYQARN